MLFNSLFFIFVFLPITLVLFFCLAKTSKRYALGVLLVASIIFYGSSNYRYIWILLLSIGINFLLNKYLYLVRSVKTKKRLLGCGLIFNLSLLGYYKYTDFFINNINSLLSLHCSAWNIVLPIGISFFTFTQIAFLVDNYRGLTGKTRFLNYALFVTYFPHLIAGPIIHHKDVMPQFEKKKIFNFSYRHFALGVTFFSIGLFKKTVLADHLAAYVSPIFDTHLQHIALLDAWVAAIAYSLQLYFDFSGYSDMAIGLSQLIGIKLPVNFYSPYKAVNIIDFWRRWNITLSKFLRDYLYFTLGGNRKGTVRRYINIMLTMILGGLWHGASWTFVLWGSFHGIFLCINHLWDAIKKYMGLKRKNWIGIKILSVALTFVALTAAQVPVRASTFSGAIKILHSMFCEKLVIPSYWHLPYFLNKSLKAISIDFSADQLWVTSHESLMFIVASLLIVWLLPNSYELLYKYKPALLVGEATFIQSKSSLLWKPTMRWNVTMAAFLIFGLIYIQSSSIFLYFRF